MNRLDTLLAQAGSRWDERTGAVTMPIYQTATFRHPALGESTGFDYSRSGNPTRLVLEELMAKLDGGVRGFAFSSGLAAIDCVLQLFQQGDIIIFTEDIYGGTFRLLDKIYKVRGVTAIYIDTSDIKNVERAFNNKKIKAIFLESPTNPMLKCADISAIAEIARKNAALTIVDNTFLTPCLQRPLDLGADITVYSATKYLAGHNDVLAGIVVVKNEALAEKIYFYQNAIGAVLGPFDSWLVLRGLKTLSIRLQRQQENAAKIAEFLRVHRKVNKVYYPDKGAIVSFEVKEASLVPHILKNVKVFLFAESLGGVESLITFPKVQTHADMDEKIRERLGINDKLLRISVGIEDFEDLKNDLEAVLT
ncbi:MAG: PLP-dependent aspartate aminotransferase family protein [bacterium]